MSALLALSTGVVAQSDPFLELGIPTSAPWEDPAAKKAGAAKAEAAVLNPLEAALPGRLAGDLAELLAARAELAALPAYARTRPQVFPPAPVENAVAFEEYRVEARDAWVRALDFLLALDAAAARYADAPRVKARAPRAAAFGVLALSYAARARFVRSWDDAAARDAALGRLFDEAVPELGTPEGAWTRLLARFSAENVRRDAGLVRAAWRAGGSAKVLSPAAAAAVEADLKALSPVSTKRFSLQAAAAAAGPEFALPSDPAPAPAAAPERPRPAFLPPMPAGELTVSSRVAAAVGAVRHFFLLDASTAPAVPSRAELRELASTLRPGDILLARRMDGRGGLGRPGWWDAAGIYLGGDADRRSAFGDDSLSASLRAAAPSLAVLSTATASEDLLSVVTADRAGVRAAPLARFGAATALAALRPRVAEADKAEALLRAARLIGGALRGDEGELLERVYAGTPAPGALAKRFDESFGTPAQAFDFVAGLRPGAEHGDRRMSVSEFRAASRRPKWDFVDSEEKKR
ncbi:MAG: hypothetical protein HYZ75_06055 [Elusimicrobia bacterium]|nr:hypothetical protein [Elusimicrobiota bacterium]